MLASPSRLAINGVSGFLRRGHRQASLNEVPLEPTLGHPWQHNLSNLAASAGHMQPVIALRIDFDGSERRTHELGGAKSGAVSEVDQEAKPLGGAWLPTIRPLQAIGDGPCELPFALGEGSRRVQRRLGERGDAGPTQRCLGEGCRKKARYATASFMASDDSATPRSTIAHKISLSASLR